MTTMFTQRHYIVIAEAIKKTNSLDCGLVAELVEIFRMDNPKFNEERFVKACRSNE